MLRIIITGEERQTTKNERTEGRGKARGEEEGKRGKEKEKRESIRKRRKAWSKLREGKKDWKEGRNLDITESIIVLRWRKR